MSANTSGVLRKRSDPAPRLVIFESLMQSIPKSAIVVAENQIVCSIKPSKETPLLVDYSFLVLFAIYYIFYISCSPRYKQLFEFFDQNLLGKLRLS